MKLFIYAILIVQCLTARVAFSEDLESICRTQRMGNSCLLGLLNLKCITYSGMSGAIGRELSCQQASLYLVNLLDMISFSQNKTQSINEEVVFTKDLRIMMESESTSVLLSGLLDSLNHHLQSGKSFFLWNEVFIRSNKDRALALKTIAILFQDTTDDSVYQHYLTTTFFSKTAVKNVKMLKEFISYFSLDALEELPLIEVYPQELGRDLNKSFYHFYLIYYLSEGLAKLGVSREMSFFVPFLFNTQYELKDINKYWPLFDPTSKTAITDWKMRDIYAGLLATLKAVGQFGQRPSFSDFSQKFSTNPAAFLKEMYFIRFSPERSLSY
jgi:hypothetical protein